MPLTLFRNPDCGASRTVLQMVRDAGHEPEVVEYLKAGWTADGLKGLLVAAGAGLLEPGVSDAAILAA